MATLKGQNFRILIKDATSANFKCIGMATNCTVNLNTSTEDASTKDDVGMASKPTVTMKSWTVQVDSLNVADVGAMLTAIKSLTEFKLAWDETESVDNQTASGTTYQRVGDAYLSDASFTFDDRTNSAKSLTFTGVSPLEYDSYITTATIAAGSYTKGQFVRLFLSADNTATPSKVIAAARQLTLHVSLTLESMTTKDTDGDWDVQEPTGLSYDISTTALVSSGENITSAVEGQALEDLETIYEASLPVKWLIANTSGDNNRTKGTVIVSGSAIIQSLSVSAANRQTATYTAQLNGYGAYTVGA